MAGHDRPAGLVSDSEARFRVLAEIALTAYGRDEDRERALRAGVVDHLTKRVAPALSAARLRG
jgi:CheY-like chemotaxis protein